MGPRSKSAIDRERRTSETKRMSNCWSVRRKWSSEQEYEGRPKLEKAHQRGNMLRSYGNMNRKKIRTVICKAKGSAEKGFHDPFLERKKKKKREED